MTKVEPAPALEPAPAPPATEAEGGVHLKEGMMDLASPEKPPFDYGDFAPLDGAEKILEVRPWLICTAFWCLTIHFLLSSPAALL